MIPKKRKCTSTFGKGMGGKKKGGKSRKTGQNDRGEMLAHSKELAV